MSKLLDTNYKELLEYYNKTCDLECNKNKYCPYKFANACLGDILFNDEKDNRTLRDLLKEILENDK